jgi:hypothetical protein
VAIADVDVAIIAAATTGTPTRNDRREWVTLSLQLHDLARIHIER